MSKTKSAISKKVGLPPGALIHVGKKKTEKVKISVIDYDATEFSENEYETIEECFSFREKNSVTWINIDGLHDTSLIAKIGKEFNLHPLLMEDILNTRHRPKLEEFDDCLFLTLKMLGVAADGNSIVSEQVSFVLGEGWVISFQEEEGDVFHTLRQRLRENKGLTRKRGADYLLYRLIDTVVDNYFLVTEHIGEENERIEEKVLSAADTKTLQQIQRQKKLLISFRRSIGPLREAVGALQKESVSLIQESTIRYLRDVYEHIIQVNDSIDSQREMIANIMDLYLSGVSNRMNQVMQVLTIISTIFIPLTFLAGIYGMNFDNIPELHWKYGYFGVWGVMFVVLIAMLFYFRKKKWL